MRKWRHEVSERWMAERAKHITATDIVSLLPEYRRIKKAGGDLRKVTPAFAGFLGRKWSLETEDTVSVNAAARGHIMEPWCVRAFNIQQAGPEMHHWDDILVSAGKPGTLAFSPDAMDIPMPSDALRCSYTAGELAAARAILEVKSYGAEKHAKKVLEVAGGARPTDEIYQLAVAFAVMPELEEAYMAFFNPVSKARMHVSRWTRDDLAEEIETVIEVAALCAKASKMARTLMDTGAGEMLDACCLEQEVYDSWLSEIEDSGLYSFD